MNNMHERTWAQEMKSFITFWDPRFEDYQDGQKGVLICRDLLAGLVVALVAIPLGIGFAIASGMRPETGIIAGAFAGLLGGLLGGSKYQVYGPTAAFIPLISAIVSKYDVPFLVLTSIAAGVIVMLLGVTRLGKYFALVPHSIIVGFSIGIALTIAISQAPNILGETGTIGHQTIDKLLHIPNMFENAHAHAFLLAIFTFFITRKLAKISVFIPGALLATLFCTYLANGIWHDHLIPLVTTQYGDIGGRLFAVVLPSLGHFSPADLLIPVSSIVIIGSLESLLSSRMADRLAGTKSPYSPNKELFAQGIVNIVVPLLNGFPCTGALARTATSIKLGAVSPFASIFKGISVIVLMVFFARYLALVPMSCVGGLLLYVATNMVKKDEVMLVLKSGKLETALMLYTAVMTLLTDLCCAVVSATAAYYLLRLIPARQPAVLSGEYAEFATLQSVEVVESFAVPGSDAARCDYCGANQPRALEQVGPHSIRM